MCHEILVGLKVINDDVYTDYRNAMMPILKTFGGGFRYDFKISEVLKKDTENEINRVFTIYFRDKNAMEAFFSNEEYLKIKKRFFETSVASTTIISEYTS